MSTDGWAPDALLPGYLARTLPARVPDDRALAGRLAAAGRADPVLTLVRPTDAPADPVGIVVHLHGYNDYFFATQLVDAVTGAGWAFLAVDARRAGRSLRAAEVPHYQADLREQADDLNQAVAAARQLWGGRPVVVHGHSTGGLVAALWAHAHRRDPGLAGLVLNSPFLSVERSWIVPVADPALRALARRAPLRVISSSPSRYAERLLDRWSFDPTLKRPEGVPVRAAWLAAVRTGQRRVARGLAVGVPVLVAHSARSGADVVDWSDLDSADTVLDVGTIADLAPRLGPDVRVVAIEGAVHDLALSRDGPRAAFLAELTGFLGQVPGPRPAPRGSAWPPRPAGRRREPAVIAHRGSSWVAPQNTLPAFEAAARAGADAVELDLQLTADGQVVVVHDATVDATTDGTGPVASFTAAGLRALDAGAWFAPCYAGTRVPTWAEVLDLASAHPGVGLLVELKDDWDAAGVARVVEPLRVAGAAGRAVLQSFSRTTVAALARVAPDVPRGLLVETADDDLLGACASLGVVACNPSGPLLVADPGLVDRLHGAGLQVMVWTLDEDAMWDQALRIGVDAIITDRPDRLAGWLAGRARCRGGRRSGDAGASSRGG